MTTDNKFQQFNKTKMCKFDAVGRCKKGRECPFAHDASELKPVPDLRCTKLCKSLVLNGVCTDPSCGYAHGKEELRSTGTFHKTKLCRFMQTGHCALGKKCNFAHTVRELREMDNFDGSPKKADTLQEDVLLPQGAENDISDLTLPEGMMLPPGLGWENLLAYDSLAEMGAMNNDIPDLSALSNIPDLSLFGQALDSDMLWFPSKVGETFNEPVLESPAQTSLTLAHDSPAYIQSSLNLEADLPSTPMFKQTSGGSGGSDQMGYLKFDAFNGDILSLSTRSPPTTPPSSDMDTPTGSGSGSGKALDSTPLSGLYHEGNWGPLSPAAQGLGGFGCWDADFYAATMSFEDQWDEASYALPSSFVC